MLGRDVLRFAFKAQITIRAVGTQLGPLIIVTHVAAMASVSSLMQMARFLVDVPPSAFLIADGTADDAPSGAEEFFWLNAYDILEGAFLETILEEPERGKALEVLLAGVSSLELGSRPSQDSRQG